MEFERSRVPVESNVVYLSSLFGGEVNPAVNHRCNHACHVEHVWANLYRCVSTGCSHVCDKNCNQRILYDNLSSICRVSGQIFPLSQLEREASLKCVRRKRESVEGVVPPERSLKRRCESSPRRPASPFESMFQFVVPASGSGQASMDLS